MTEPTTTNKKKAADQTSPAPPCHYGYGHGYEGYTGIGGGYATRAEAQMARVQRQTCSSPNVNTMKEMLVVTVDWVMEPEVPRPEGTFLQWPTRRAFMEDDVQARVQVKGMALSSKASITFEIKDKDKGLNPDDDLLCITSDAAVHGQRKSKVTAILRPVKVVKDIGKAGWSETSKHILLETNPAKKISYLLTSVTLPEDPSGTESDDLEYYFVVTITDQSQTLSEVSAVLDGLRWWANPKENLKYPKDSATEVKALIDGEEYFKEMVKAIDGATHHVYVATWTMWLKTFLTGEPAGGGRTFAEVVTAAAARGVNVYILADYFNGRWVIPLLNAHMKHPRIFVKSSSHPDTVLGKQHGSYHEKYVCVDGKVAILGGIDVEPDRYQPIGHGWKSDHLKYGNQAVAMGENMFGEEFLLWHDTGVLIRGSPVGYVEDSFAFRWNFGNPAGNKLARKLPARSSTQHNVQVVKTDYLKGGPISLRFKGTLDAYKRAILEARHYIYIENQYFSYPGLRDLLYDALASNKSLQFIAVIPFVTEEALAMGAVKFPNAYWVYGKAWGEAGLQNRIAMHGLYLQAELIKKLRSVTDAKNRVGIYALAGCVGSRPQMIYPHSKTMIVDDTWAYIGSANTNGRGFVTDGEIGVVVHDRAAVTQYRRALWKEHLGVDLETRKIREFFKAWNSKAIKGKTKPSDCTCAQLSALHAVELKHPPPGQKYNGPLSSILNVDDYA